MLLVENLGLPDAERHAELLGQVQEAMRGGGQVVCHQVQLPGAGDPNRKLSAVAVRMGRDGEDFGRLMLAKLAGEFSEEEVAILRAIGSDIGGALRSVRLISEARRLADRDPVTGLHNHRSVYQRLHSELERHERIGKPMAVLMMDLDNFKLFNDTYGHPAGDEVLKRVAMILRRSCRDADTVARYGGDEFMVLLSETNLRAAIRCAERIQSVLAKERFRCQNSATLPIGFSYGISVYPDDAKDVQELVTIADSNLYQSKTQGGNQITARGSSVTDNTLVHVKGFDLFRAMVQAIDNKDGYTKRHSEEVTEYSLEIARAMNLGEEMLQTLQLSCILHDVGKIGVPDHILRKPGHLTDDEFQVMQQHPVFGALIVGAMPGMEEVVHGVRHHHERYDGAGYPDRLAGTNIPLMGRIMAVADAYSAMTTTRPYRKGLTERQALQQVLKGLGTQFDPEIGELFIKLREHATATRKPASRRAVRAPDPEPIPAIN
jgi:diguanylate cyclase (GGDEF)-like protein